MSIENWKTDLAPLLHGFKAEKPWRKENEADKFTDQFGNYLNVSIGSASDLLQLLRDPSLITVEVETDKGYLSYTVYQHVDSYYIVYETRVDCDGVCGHFKQYVVIPALDDLIQFLEEWNSPKRRRF